MIPASGEPGLAETAYIERLQRRHVGLQIHDRHQVLQFAAIICNCRAWFDPGDFTAPQSGCPVHQTVLISPDGRFWL